MSSYTEEYIRSTISSHSSKAISSIKRLDSLSNSVFLITFSDESRLILKIFKREGATNHFLSFYGEAEAMIVQSKYLEDVILFDSYDYRIERYIPNRHLTEAEFQSHLVRLQLTKEAARFQRLHSQTAANAAYAFHLREHILPLLRPQVEGYLGSHSQAALIRDFWSRGEDFLLSIEKNERRGGKTVFAHNDLLLGNILLTPDRFLFIDFEYSCFSFEFNDLYNFVTESCKIYAAESLPGFAQDWSAFPSDQQIFELIFAFKRFRDQPDMPDTKIPGAEELERIVEDSKGADKATVREELEKFFFVGAIVELYWAYWALNIEEKKDTLFDYPLFAINRFEGFARCLAKLEELKEESHRKA